eukprot:7979924-Pyramimonas_sp.AAC.1
MDDVRNGISQLSCPDAGDGSAERCCILCGDSMAFPGVYVADAGQAFETVDNQFLDACLDALHADVEK